MWASVLQAASYRLCTPAKKLAHVLLNCNATRTQTATLLDAPVQLTDSG